MFPLMNISPGRLAESAGCPADIVKIVDHHDPFLNEFHFDRRSQYFEDILGLYHTGSLHMSLDGCRMAFMEELEYWEIDEMLLANCCHTVTCHQCSLIMTPMYINIHNIWRRLEGSNHCQF